MCPNFGSFLCKNFLNMGVFMKKSITMGLILKISKFFEIFENILRIWCVFAARNGYLFSEKIPKYGYLWTWEWVLSCRRHIPNQTKSETPPPPGETLYSLKYDCDCHPGKKKYSDIYLWFSTIVVCFRDL